MTDRYEKQKFKQGYTHIVGCDEVGRGCLAGPVVAAAVVFDNSRIKDKGLRLLGIDDSKLLTPKKREYLSEAIKQSCVAWGIGLVEHSVIDEINIHHASLRAMRLAVEGLLESLESCGASPPARGGVAAEGRRGGGSKQTLNPNPLVSLREPLPLGRGRVLRSNALVALDGKFTIPNFHMQQEAIVDGDAKVLSIAAASIIAKVYRDNLMRELDRQYPGYEFGQHKGYATALHRGAIKKYGLTPIHRLSFCSQFRSE